jgi:RND family efflux transporter MFP subunit
MINYSSPIFCILFIGIVFSASGQSFRGITEPYRHSTISATVAGRIALINFKDGDIVKKGDIILELEKDEEELETSRRKLISESNFEITAAELQINSSKLDFEATKSLFETTHSVSEEELWKKELDYKLAVNELNQLAMMQKREEIEYKIAQAQLNKSIIHAPFNGIIVNTFLRLGESCNALEPLVRIVDISKCRFICHVDASASHLFRKGMNITIALNGTELQLNVDGTVEYMSPVVDPSSNLREIRIVFENHDNKIQPGVSGTILMDRK